MNTDLTLVTKLNSQDTDVLRYTTYLKVLREARSAMRAIESSLIKTNGGVIFNNYTSILSTPHFTSRCF